MIEDHTHPHSAPAAPKPIRRPLRILAVTAATALLMATTGFGIAAVTQVLNANANTVTSAEAVVSTPVTITPTLADSSSLPDLSKAPALPSIKKILKSIKATKAASPSTGATSKTTSVPVSTEPAAAETAEAERPQTDHGSVEHEKRSHEQDEHESDD